MIRLLSKALVAAVLILAVSGCNEWKNVDLGGLKIPDLNTPAPVDNDTDDRNITPKILETLKSASKEDCLTYTRYYLGLSEYLKHTSNITNTTQLFPPTGVTVGVRSDYKIEVGKNKEFTDFIEKDLESLGLDKPKSVDDTVRTQLVKTFRVYGNAAFTASQSK